MLNEPLVSGRNFVKTVRILGKVALALALVGILIYGGVVSFSAIATRAASLSAVALKEDADCKAAQKKLDEAKASIEEQYTQRLAGIDDHARNAQSIIEGKRTSAGAAISKLNDESAILDTSMERFPKPDSVRKVPTMFKPSETATRQATMSELDSCASAVAENKAALVAALIQQYDRVIKALDDMMAPHLREKGQIKAELDKLEAKYRPYTKKVPKERSRGSVTELPPNVFGQGQDAIRRVNNIKREILDVASYYPSSLDSDARASVSRELGEAVNNIRQWLPVPETKEQGSESYTEDVVVRPEWSLDDQLRRDRLQRQLSTLDSKLAALERDKREAEESKKSVNALLTSNWAIDPALNEVRAKLTEYFDEVEHNTPEYYAQQRREAAKQKETGLSNAAANHAKAVDGIHASAKVERLVIRKAFVATMSAYLFGPLSPAVMLLLAFLGYWLVQVLADYLVCPLALVKLNQELVRDSRKKDGECA